MSDTEKMKVGSDIDDVLVPFMQGYISYHNMMHRTKIRLIDVSNYHLWKCGIHNSKEESIKEVLEFQNSIYFDSLGLIPGAKEVLEELSRRYSVPFITSRPEEMEYKTKNLFKKYFPKNGFDIFYSGEIYGGNLSKAEICKANNIPFIIEDNPDYAIDCAINGITVLLPDKPWNVNCEKHDKIIRMNELEEALEILK